VRYLEVAIPWVPERRHSAVYAAFERPCWLKARYGLDIRRVVNVLKVLALATLELSRI